MSRTRALLAALVLAASVLLGAGAPASQADDPPPPSFALPLSLDLHDGVIQKFGGTYYAYGTQYRCGFQWQVPSTWCGFGASSAPSLAGPWSTPVRLFSPADTDPWTSTTWQTECGGGSAYGCFNPRMLQRTGWGSDDGTFILWFNSPADYARNHANAYNAMGCNGPLGPCGPSAGPPHGSYVKPSLTICAANGDFGFIASATPGARPALVCTMPGSAALNIEELNTWGVGGDGTGVQGVAGLAHIESPGGWYDAAAGRYVLTYSDANCGYCTGTGTGYATAPSLYGTWTAPVNLGFGQPANGRRVFSANSCGGQPRTVSLMDGQAFQGIDLWTGSRNETAAGAIFVPLTFGTATGTPGDGGVWRPPLTLDC
ncbi:hypothetical protein G3I60_42430 [Streptomyces sp. SID13666]|uniref:hypothetical protein n=1 Tax=unclassified Streptomyces TaxID=2593676 RepID=UPI0013C20FD3|nr:MULTISPECIES: hypothetical protein [unclassified Streptomyces]NEA60649.1 hypothetical protein [Streptomyces sp. SID13666]NEA77067.1 hypothetical protein [Streptomyces sp. SID13588]